MLYIERKYCSRCGCTLYSSLIIVISLQLCGHRQIAEPRKYCLVRVIVLLWRVFSQLIVFLIGWEFDLIPFNRTKFHEVNLQSLHDTNFFVSYHHERAINSTFSENSFSFHLVCFVIFYSSRNLQPKL